MKKLIIGLMITLITITSNVSVYGVEVPEADVNDRSYTFTYQTTTQDEMLYYSGYLSTTYNSKKQVIEYIGALYGDYTDNIYGGAKIHYYNQTSGSPLSSVAIDLNEYHELDSSYNYYRIQLVYALVTSISQDRIFYENTQGQNTYTTISEGVAISYATLQYIYQQGYNDGEFDAYDGAYDDGYDDGYAVGLNDNLDLNAIGNNMASGMADILNMSIGGITLGALVLIPLSFSLFMWFMKVVRK